jgi:hypothetical protein
MLSQLGFALWCAAVTSCHIDPFSFRRIHLGGLGLVSRLAHEPS